jgi:hypothetical protein
MTTAARTWIVGLVLASSVVEAAPVFAQNATMTPLMVFIEDRASVPANILEQAREEATRVFRIINVEIIWLELGDGRFENSAVLRSVLIVDVVTREIADRLKARDGVLGSAALGTRLARVFYKRIEDLSSTRHDIGCLLGHVMAHEIGHLLLPPNSHSPHGIMQAQLDTQLAVRSRLFFTESQARVIQTKLADFIFR